MGLKDAWYSGCQRSEEGVERNTLVVVYQYKNLGPREELEPLAWGDVRKEIKTDKGHIFPGGSLCGSPQALFAMPEGKRRAFWWPKATRKFEETGESALVFAIPKDEVPTEVVAAGRICGGRIDLNLKLPQGPVGSRSYSKAFGFLPRTAEKAVPVFIEALQDHREDIRKAAAEALGTVGPAAKEAVPALIAALSEKSEKVRVASLQTLGNIGPAARDAVPNATELLLRDRSMDVRTAAATTLGQIGPEAKEAIPALKRPFRDSDPRGVLPWPSEVDFYEAVYQALIRIGGAADAVATIRR